MTDFPPTVEQERALSLFGTGQSLALEAGAGTGKTTTLILLARSTTKRGQYLAFNKAIVTDASAKMPSNVACHTAHALAFRAIGKNYAHRLRSPRMKSWELAKLLDVGPLSLTTWEEKHKRIGESFLAGLALRTVTAFCQSADPEPTVEHVPHVPALDDPRGPQENNELVRHHIMGAVRRAWADLSKTDGVLPFRHDQYLKLYQLSDPRIHADFILFDEAQDANPVMVAIVAGQTHAQLVWVGDSQQQIYGFTGAVNALASVPADQRAYLTQSFRFGPEIAAVANTVLDDLKAELRLKGLPSLSMEKAVTTIADPDVILARTNAEAVRSVLEAKKKGLGVHLVGGGTEVVSFAKAARKLMEGGAPEHPELACFDSWDEVKEYVEFDAQGGELRLLVGLVEDFGVQVILDALDDMIPEAAANLVVSTAHKAKGREWDAVKLAPDFPAEMYQDEELRLLYVAVTRARRLLDVSAVGYFAEFGVLPTEAADAAPVPTAAPADAQGAAEEPEGAPFACPSCGATDAWRADYYEARWQTVHLVAGEDGEPEIVDYTGSSDTYDDSSTSDECYRCGSCDHTIDLVRFVEVPVDRASPEAAQRYLEELGREVGYHEDEEGSVDLLIEYKNTVEERLAASLAAFGPPPGFEPDPVVAASDEETA